MSSCSADGLNQYYYNSTQLFSPFGLSTLNNCSDACPPNWDQGAQLACFDATTVTAVSPLTGNVSNKPLSDWASGGFGYASSPFGTGPTAYGALASPFDKCTSDGPNQFCEFGMVNDIPTSNCCVTNVGAILSSAGFFTSTQIQETCTHGNSDTTGCYPCTATTSAAVVGQVQNTSAPAGVPEYTTFYQCLPVVVNVAFDVTATNNCDVSDPSSSLAYTLYSGSNQSLMSGTVTPSSKSGSPVPLGVSDYITVNGKVPCCCGGTHSENAGLTVHHQDVWGAIQTYNKQHPSSPINPLDFTVNVSLTGEPSCAGTFDTECRQHTVSLSLSCSNNGSVVQVYCPTLAAPTFQLVA